MAKVTTGTEIDGACRAIPRLRSSGMKRYRIFYIGDVSRSARRRKFSRAGSRLMSLLGHKIVVQRSIGYAMVKGPTGQPVSFKKQCQSSQSLAFNYSPRLRHLPPSRASRSLLPGLIVRPGRGLVGQRLLEKIIQTVLVV